MTPVPETTDAEARYAARMSGLPARTSSTSAACSPCQVPLLDLALWRMGSRLCAWARVRYPLATDAKQVVYASPRIAPAFRSPQQTGVNHLHLVCCTAVFRHPFDEGHTTGRRGLALRHCRENAAMDLVRRKRSPSCRRRRVALARARCGCSCRASRQGNGLVKGLMQTPDGQQYRGMGRSALNEWRAPARARDDHGAWPANNKAKGRRRAGRRARGGFAGRRESRPRSRRPFFHRDARRRIR